MQHPFAVASPSLEILNANNVWIKTSPTEVRGLTSADADLAAHSPSHSARGDYRRCQLGEPRRPARAATARTLIDRRQSGQTVGISIAKDGCGKGLILTALSSDSCPLILSFSRKGRRDAAATAATCSLSPAGSARGCGHSGWRARQGELAGEGWGEGGLPVNIYGRWYNCVAVKRFHVPLPQRANTRCSDNVHCTVPTRRPM
jgi:hypothetical protein